VIVAEKEEITKEYLSPVASTAMAMYSLKMAILELKEDSIF